MNSSHYFLTVSDGVKFKYNYGLKGIVKEGDKVREKEKEFDPTHHLAVYGTLKEGYYNWKRYLNKRPFWSGPVKIYGYLVDDGLPKLVPDSKLHDVYVELYSVTSRQLKAIDNLEGHPYLYERRLFNHRIYGKVWIYFWVKDFPRSGEVVINWIKPEWRCEK